MQVRSLSESRQVFSFFINPFDYMGDWSKINLAYLESSSKNQSSMDRLLLVADRKKAPEAAKQLWDLEPTNAALFANYAACYFGEGDRLPPDFMETAERLDPDNGWFPALAAAAFAQGSVKGESVATAGKGTRDPKLWTILDPAKLEQSIGFLHRAVSLPKYESYQVALEKRRLASLPPATDVRSALMDASCCTEARPSSNYEILELAKVIAAKSQMIASSGDQDGFRSLLKDWVSLSKAMMSQKDLGIMDLLVQRAFVSMPVRNLKATAEDLALAEESRCLDKVDALIQSKGKERRARDLSEVERLIEDRGSLFGKTSLDMTNLALDHPPILNEVDLKPGRRIDHALFSSTVSVALVAMFLVLAAAVGAYRYRHGKLCRDLAIRLAALFTMQDWCLVLSCGLILPSLYFVAIRYFTPMGRLGWSLKMPFLLIPAGQYALLFCLILATSVLMLRHRLYEQTSFFETPCLRQKVGISITVVGFVALPAWGLSEKASWLEPTFIVGVVGLGLLLVWLLGLATRSMFGRADLALGRQMVGRLLVPILITAAAVFSALIPLHHAEERYWMRKDKVVGLNPENPNSSEHETTVKDQMRADLLEVLAPLEAISR